MSPDASSSQLLLALITPVLFYPITVAVTPILTRNGIANRGITREHNKVVIPWAENISVERTKTIRVDHYKITGIDNNDSFTLDARVFEYPEVIDYIYQYAPPHHKFRDLINSTI